MTPGPRRRLRESPLGVAALVGSRLRGAGLLCCSLIACGPSTRSAPSPTPSASAAVSARAPEAQRPGLRIKPKDGALWGAEGIAGARMGSDELHALSATSCTLDVLRPQDGARQRRIPLPSERVGPAIECACTLGAGLVGCTRRSRALVVASAADGVTRFGEEPAHEDLRWQPVGTARGLAALETPWRQLEPLPPPRLLVFDAPSGGRTSVALAPTAERELIPGVGRFFLNEVSRVGESSTSARDEKTGVEQWRFVAAAGERLRVLASDERFVVVGAPHALVLLEAESGKWRWRSPISGLSGEPAVALGTDAVFIVDPSGPKNVLRALDLDDGQLRWQRERPAGNTSLAAAADRVFWLTHGTLAALTADRGEEQWRWYGEPESVVIAPSPDLVLLRSDVGRTTALAAASQLTPRSRPATIAISVTSELPGLAQDLSGIAVSIGETEYRTDPRGRVTLDVEGRGRVPVAVHADAWLGSQPLRAPRGTFPCAAVTKAVIDLEGLVPLELPIVIAVRACPIR